MVIERRRAEILHPDIGPALLLEAKDLGRFARHVDDPITNEGATIVHPHHHARPFSRLVTLT